MAEDLEYSMAPLTLAINTDPFVFMFNDKLSQIFILRTYIQHHHSFDKANKWIAKQN
jgi:hypothetical protein